MEVVRCLKSMESFGECRKRLSQLIRDHGLPSCQIWVDWGDVIVNKGELFVLGLRNEDHSAAAEARFLVAANKNAGVAVEVVCTVHDATCCFVYLPSDRNEAERLMIPQRGVKLSVPTVAPEAKLIANQITWWLLKLRGSDYLKSTRS